MAPRTVTITSTVEFTALATAASNEPSSTSLYLPAQTTPFSYDGPGCTPSVYCADLTTVVYPQTSYQFGVSLCFGVNAVESVVALSTGVYMAYNNFCMPENYYELFGDQRKQAVYDWPHATSEGARSTLAYPGTACPNQWSAACTTTLTHEGLQYPQAWCCPPGDWQCTSGVGPMDATAGPQRLCVSAVSEPTEVWMSFDPATTLSNGQEAATWHVPVSGNGALVYHKVFPLSLTEGAGFAERGEATYTTAVETTAPSPDSSSSLGEVTVTAFPVEAPGNESRVSTVAATGTMAGAVAVVGLATWALLRHKRRRQHAKVQEACYTPPDRTRTVRGSAKSDGSVFNRGPDSAASS
ncbi:hypothetical protein PFICI_06439 [Pestalotiopsis fici W106-1]|uniref:Uncharacterized protein n=1 Tax=Pestalotiopsis fici (strain W106-1 / CGMCC3.15140) TaxID=1229662 RepID=W3X7S1_PESFW|nr:uncharacterized protein PFICI_06439 [Pestalotiopsis fici W106-1]ETS81437.1 hypothetical protein PFICI_06439 [Pestalotiopsis fici W106-1]